METRIPGAVRQPNVTTDITTVSARRRKGWVRGAGTEPPRARKNGSPVLVSGGSHGRAPARFREALGIRGRQTVVVGLSGDSLRVRTLDSALERLQRIARRRNPDAARAVDDFIDDRRAEEIVVIR